MRQNKPVTILLIAGLLLMSASLIFEHYVHINDLASGILKGIAVGLLILSVLLPRIKTAR